MGILSSGIWQQRDRLEPIVGGAFVRVRPWTSASRFDAIAGWGYKPTARRARDLAAATGKPYVAIEDGFLRSIRPGRSEPSCSYLIDRSGVHYDASAPSDMERAIATAVSTVRPPQLGRAAQALALLRRLRLSKYNDGPELDRAALGVEPAASRRHVLVVDQTVGDAAIVGAGATPNSFRSMLQAAMTENADATILIKSHPEVISGVKRGHLAHLRGPRLVVVGTANPWSLFDVCDTVYTVSSQLGLEALIAGCRVVCFGAPFYAGWGLTEDRVPLTRRRARPSIEQLFHAAYLDLPHYVCPYSGREIAFEDAAERLAYLRDRFHENTQRAICLGVSRWKRQVVEPHLTGAAGPPAYALTIAGAVRKARRCRGRVVVWASKWRPRHAALAARANVPLVQIEDGFIRSRGLGAAYVKGYSLAIDTTGIYFDPGRISDLEHLLESAPIGVALLRRAERLRRAILAAGITKYNVGMPDRDTRYFLPDREAILVPGQVEDDASVKACIPRHFVRGRGESINMALLRAVRHRNPLAYIVYKPHPDVIAGRRKGALTDADAMCFADRIARNVSIVPLIEQCDRLETLSSLSGFEALIRGKPVTVHGAPFYAGWGLTEDLSSIPRRTRRLNLDELVAVALLLYPRYLDPASRKPCPAEMLVDALSPRAVNDGFATPAGYHAVAE